MLNRQQTTDGSLWSSVSSLTSVVSSLQSIIGIISGTLGERDVYWRSFKIENEGRGMADSNNGDNGVRPLFAGAGPVGVLSHQKIQEMTQAGPRPLFFYVPQIPTPEVGFGCGA